MENGKGQSEWSVYNASNERSFFVEMCKSCLGYSVCWARNESRITHKSSICKSIMIVLVLDWHVNCLSLGGLWK